MITTELVTRTGDDTVYIRTYSDQGMMIEEIGTGGYYEDVVDREDSGREFIETDIPIVHEGSDGQLNQIINILLGGES